MWLTLPRERGRLLLLAALWCPRCSILKYRIMPLQARARGRRRGRLQRRPPRMSCRAASMQTPPCSTACATARSRPRPPATRPRPTAWQAYALDPAACLPPRAPPWWGPAPRWVAREPGQARPRRRMRAAWPTRAQCPSQNSLTLTLQRALRRGACKLGEARPRRGALVAWPRFSTKEAKPHVNGPGPGPAAWAAPGFWPDLAAVWGCRRGSFARG